jgi:hypothetical protein
MAQNRLVGLVTPTLILGVPLFAIAFVLAVIADVESVGRGRPR